MHRSRRHHEAQRPRARARAGAVALATLVIAGFAPLAGSGSDGSQAQALGVSSGVAHLRATKRHPRPPKVRRPPPTAPLTQRAAPAPPPPPAPAPTTTVAPPHEPVTAPAAPPPTASPFVGRAGATLTVDGHEYRAVGLNAYELATFWGANAGCGGMLDDAALDQFFGSLPRGTLVRMWGFQGSMATDPTTGARVWAPLDRVVDAAARHGQRLVVALGNQAGNCDDGHWKDRAWYLGGYRDVYQGTGSEHATVSYWDWVREIVRRYRDSAAVAMWEPVNEPEASECAPGLRMDACYPHLQCPDQTAAAAALRSFFDAVGQEIKQLDPNHLVESGSIGGTQCGWTSGNAAMVGASPGIDVLSYHDYITNEVLPGELNVRLAEAAALDKPLIVGELGISASDTSAACSTRADRRDRVRAKADAMLSTGVAAVLLWGWVPDPASGCSLDIGRGDPVLETLRST
jgi:mannan endo-1,4-beta-mannosidase